MNTQFIHFLNRISEQTGQRAICEAIKRGYHVCCEGTVGDDEFEPIADEDIPVAVRELAEETGNDLDDADITEESDCTKVEFGNQEYRIYSDYDAAVAAAVESEYQLLSDDLKLQYCGINMGALGKTWRDYCYPSVLEDLVYEDDEGNKFSVEDEINWNDAKSVSEYISDDYIDWKKLAEDVVAVDAPAHTLASYDGNEIELPCGAYAYRTN